MGELPSWAPQFFAWVFGAGGPVVGIYFWNQRRKQRPIDTSTAQVANAVAISNMAKGVVEMVNNEIKDLKVHSELQDQEIVSLKERVAQIEHVWETWYKNLVEQWSIVRLLTEPPDGPNRKYKK